MGDPLDDHRMEEGLDFLDLVNLLFLNHCLDHPAGATKLAEAFDHVCEQIKLHRLPPLEEMPLPKAIDHNMVRGRARASCSNTWPKYTSRSNHRRPGI